MLIFSLVRFTVTTETTLRKIPCEGFFWISLVEVERATLNVGGTFLGAEVPDRVKRRENSPAALISVCFRLWTQCKLALKEPQSTAAMISLSLWTVALHYAHK